MTRHHTPESHPIFVTGATGFVGSHFVFHALQTRQQEVVALVRGSDAQAARARLTSLLQQVAASYHEPMTQSALDRLQVCVGDLDSPRCGLSEDLVAELRADGVESLWHFAASLSFEDRHQETIERINVQGTRHVLQLAERLAAGRYNHISTAYTCGPMTGLVQEVLHDPAGPFNNHYERTKCQGEHLAAEFGGRTGTAVAILRPSIVIGPERSKLPAGSDSGLYGFAREICRLKRALASVKDALHIKGEPDSELNYMPVDRLVRDVWALQDAGYPAGPIYHLTSTSSPTVAETMAVVAEAAGVCPIVVEAESQRPASPVERLFERRADFYASYLKHGKRFARAWGGGTHVSAGELSVYARRYVATRHRDDANAPFQCQTVTTRDGMALCAYAAGEPDAEPVVLVNAYGMPVEVYAPLARELATSYRLISWESRGVPSSVGHLGADCGLARHVGDLLEVMNHFAVDGAHIVGFCTGADVAMDFAAAHPERVKSVSLVNGALWREGAPRTAFQTNIAKVMPSCARSQQHARLYHGLLFGHGESNADPEILTSWHQLLESLDPELVHMTSLPFRDPELLHRYARLMAAYAEDARQPPPSWAAPTLVLTAEEDPITHCAASYAVVRRTPQASMVRLDGSGHFGIYLDPRAWQALASFWRGASRQITARAQRVPGTVATSPVS